MVSKVNLVGYPESEALDFAVTRGTRIAKFVQPPGRYFKLEGCSSSRFPHTHRAETLLWCEDPWWSSSNQQAGVLAEKRTMDTWCAGMGLEVAWVLE